MARMPRGEPRSVPDPHDDDYDAMLKKESDDKIWRDAAAAYLLTLNDPGFAIGAPNPLKPEDIQSMSKGIEEFQGSKPVGHASTLGSFVPFYGPARNSVADLQEKNYAGAALDQAILALDASSLGEIASLAPHGLLGKAGSQTWRQHRRAYGASGFAAKGQPIHHSFIPQRMREVPDWLKHHVLGLKPMDTQAEHNLVHGKTVGGQRYNWAQRTLGGMPDWTKPFAASYAGRLVDQANRFAQSHWPWTPPAPEQGARSRDRSSQ